jgi:cytochrome c oxidase subunit 4
MNDEKILDKSLYIKAVVVLAGLLILTALTVTVSGIEMGRWSMAVALAIAAVKTTLVLIYFMHINKAARAVIITFITTIVVLTTMIGFMFWDISFR